MKLLVTCPNCGRIFLINHNNLKNCPICFKYPLRSLLKTLDI